MTTLKQHQAAMVQLLANGSGIPASASRLAHAMHDVLAYLNLEEAIHHAPLYGGDATTPGLNDRALAEDIKAVRPKQVPAEQRVKQLENTVKQLRASNAVFKAQRNDYAKRLADLDALDDTGLMPEQAACRKPDTQLPPASIPCDHPEGRVDTNIGFCSKCGEYV